MAKKARLEGSVLRLRWTSSGTNRSLQLQAENPVKGVATKVVGVTSGHSVDLADTGKHNESFSLKMMVTAFNDVSECVMQMHV